MPDAFVAFGVSGRKVAIVSALEFNRVRRKSDFDVVLPLETYLQRAQKAWPDRKVGAADVIALAARDHRVERFVVPEDFPAGLFNRLARAGIELEVADGALFPERECKTAAEAAAIRAGNACCARGFAAAEAMLSESKVVGRRLVHRRRTLTSEAVKFAIEVACLEGGGVATQPIVAGGNQACDPHERGAGPLRPHELIVIDIFPRVTKTGYFGDMTRTFLRGRASDGQRALVAAVRAAQQAAFKAIRTGVNGRAVHACAAEVFAARGFATKRTARGPVGFIHGTGHGLGLALHEAPRLSGAADHILLRGSVVTVEPGLYYHGLGGCRIEDVVQVTDRTPTLLSRYHYTWELP